MNENVSSLDNATGSGANPEQALASAKGKAPIAARAVAVHYQAFTSDYINYTVFCTITYSISKPIPVEVSEKVYY